MVKDEIKTKGKNLGDIRSYLLGLRNLNNSLSSNWGYYNILNARVNKNDFKLFVNKALELEFSKKEYSELLHINARTLNRNLEGDFTLKIDKYENAMRLYDLMLHGLEVFGNKSSFSNWLREHNHSLKNKPIDLLGSIAGIQIVDDAITRLEYGVYL